MKKLNFLIPYVSLIISISSVYYAWSGVQVANESNKISKETQKTTKNLFLVEKRPYINVYIPEVSPGSYLNIVDGDEMTASFSVEVKNEGGLPARNIEAKIYYFDDRQNSYNTLSVYVPDTHKIFPGKSHTMNISMSDKGGTPIDRAIRSQELRFQVIINYKSDADESVVYTTKKQFSVKRNGVILIGNLGEFQ